VWSYYFNNKNLSTLSLSLITIKIKQRSLSLQLQRVDVLHPSHDVMTHPNIAAAAAAALLLLLARGASAFSLVGESAVLVLPPAPSTAMQLALRDVQRDLYKVTGIAVSVLAASGPVRPGSLAPNTTVIYLLDEASAATAAPPALDTTGCFAGREAHCVLAAADGGNGYAAVFASGATERGALFAWYSFSELVLGVSPLAHFTGELAQYQAAVAVNDSMRALFAPPKFTFRTWFINDEDLLAAHRADPAGRAVFDIKTWDEICETLLRLKGNAVLPGTNPLPDDTSVAQVLRRGLALQHHHYDLLGLCVYAFPLPSSDWDWRKDAGTMAHVWRGSIAAQAAFGGEIIWSVGLRGLNDYDYPNCASPRDCGEIISEVVGNQSAWIDEIAGPGQRKVVYLWQELLGYLEAGYLTLPPGVQIIFTDSGAGYINSDPDVTHYSTGAYYHTAMYNGNANQLGEMVPLDRMFSQFRAFINYSTTTDYAIDNLSDILPCLMTSEAFMRMAWDPAPYVEGDAAAAALAFYTAWGARNFGLAPAAAAEFGALWSAYFAAPFIQGGEADNLIAGLLADVGSEAAADVAASGGVGPKTKADAASALARVGGAATPAVLLAVLARAQALLDSGAVAEPRAAFFAAHTLVGVATTALSAQAVQQLDAAVQALASGDGAGAAAGAQAAVAALDALFALRRLGEATGGGKWHGFFMGDKLSDMQRARKALRAFAEALAAPRGAPLVIVPPHDWYGFEGYLAAFAANFPTQRFVPEYNLATYARVNCVTSQVDAGVCANSAFGGAFAPGAGAAVTLQVMTSQTLPPAAAAAGAAAAEAAGQLVVRYTLDGSAPTAASPAYAAGQPIKLDAAAVAGVATVRAQAFTAAGAPAAAQSTDAVYRALGAAA